MSEKRETGLKKIVMLLTILFIIFLLLTCCYQVREKQAVELTTFEKPVATVTAPGLHFKYPWPIQKAYLFDLRVRMYESSQREYLLRDGFNIIVKAFACWAIKDVTKYKEKIGVTLAEGEKNVAELVNKYLETVLKEYRFAALVGVSESGGDSRFGLVEEKILTMMQKDALDNYGIDISSFGFDRFELPAETTKDVFDRMKSERMKMVEKIIREGEREARRIEIKADSEKSRILAEARAKAAKIRGEADTEAFEYLDVYNKNPDFAMFLNKLIALEETMKKKTTIVIDRKTPPFDMLLPESANIRSE